MSAEPVNPAAAPLKYAQGRFLPSEWELSERRAGLALAFTAFLSRHYPDIFAQSFLGKEEEINNYDSIIMQALLTLSFELKRDLLPLTFQDEQELVRLFQDYSPLDSFARYEKEFVEFLRTEL